MEHLARVTRLVPHMGLIYVLKEGPGGEEFCFRFEHIKTCGRNYRGESPEELKDFSRRGLFFTRKGLQTGSLVIISADDFSKDFLQNASIRAVEFKY